MPPHWANAHGGLAVRPRVGEATPLVLGVGNFVLSAMSAADRAP
jgi:hypothetical protein